MWEATRHRTARRARRPHARSETRDRRLPRQSPQPRVRPERGGAGAARAARFLSALAAAHAVVGLDGRSALPDVHVRCPRPDAPHGLRNRHALVTITEQPACAPERWELRVSKVRAFAATIADAVRLIEKGRTEQVRQLGESVIHTVRSRQPAATMIAPRPSEAAVGSPRTIWTPGRLTKPRRSGGDPLLHFDLAGRTPRPRRDGIEVATVAGSSPGGHTRVRPACETRSPPDNVRNLGQEEAC